MKNCPLPLDFPPILCHTNSMNKPNKHGVIASSDYLSDIARQCIERELMQRQCRVASHDYKFETWNISDRD